MFVGGFASGLDTAGIIDALMAVQERPILLRELQRSKLQVEQSAFQQINTSLANLLSTLSSLRDPDIVGARVVSQLSQTEDINKLQVAADANAALSSFTVDVVSLATATQVDSTTAVGQAIDAAVGLDKAGFEIPFTYGTFTINGTQFTTVDDVATTAVSTAVIGATVDSATTLDSAGLTVTPVASGSFTINGTSIAYDATTESLDTIVANITASAAGVTASYDSATRKVTLTADTTGPGLITLSDDVGNFLTAVDVLGATQTDGTNATTLNDVVSSITGAGIGVTASLVNDASGRPNLLKLDGGAGAVLLGAGDDTSNFLTATHVLETPAGTIRTSTRPMGVTDIAATLDQARLVTALAPTSGSFTVNGKTITYDSTVDSLANVITRINESDAGVTATYDVFTDKLRITSDSTGSAAVALADVTGNFLTATAVLAATQTAGASAHYKIDGVDRYATSNTVTDAVPGVTLTLQDTTTASITVQVLSDTTSVANRLDDLATQYNSTLSQIVSLTRYDDEGNDDGPLIGDGTVRMLQQRLRSFMISPASGLSATVDSLGDIGMGFGSVGSAVGTTGTLVFDRTKFDALMKSDPEGVRKLLAGFSASAALEAGNTVLSSIVGKPTQVKDSGTYTVNVQAGGALTLTYTPDDGSTAVITTVTVTAGEVNTTLIPGLTLNFANPLVVGEDTITITADYEGVGKSMHEYVESFTRTGGVMEGRDTELAARITDINDQIERIEVRLASRRERLILKYARLEVTMQRLQGQQQALTGLINQLNANNKK